MTREQKKSYVSAWWPALNRFSRQSLISNFIYLFTNLPRDACIDMRMHAHKGPREVYCCHIWKFYEFASHYASAEHLSIPPPRWERNEEGCCTVLSFTLTLRGDHTTVASSSVRNNAAYFFIRGFLMRPVKNQPPLTKTHSLEWTWKAGNHLFITVLKASKKKKKPAMKNWGGELCQLWPDF